MSERLAWRRPLPRESERQQTSRPTGAARHYEGGPRVTLTSVEEEHRQAALLLIVRRDSAARLTRRACFCLKGAAVEAGPIEAARCPDSRKRLLNTCQHLVEIASRSPGPVNPRANLLINHTASPG
jgi:hypothetical protein